MSVTVSVIMPARNAGDFIKKSIESILNQSYQNLELIVVNDQSTDNTTKILESFLDERLRIVNGPATGISDAFNAGLKIANGQYLCRCDADDLYPMDRIEMQVKWLDAHPENIAVCGMFSSIDPKGRHLVQYNKDTVSESLDGVFAKGGVRTHFCTYMTRTNILKKIGGCRSFFVTAEDIDLQFRLSEQGSIYFLAKNTYFYRLHEASITHTQTNTKRLFFENKAREFHKQRMQIGTDDLQRGVPPELPVQTVEKHSSVNQIHEQLISESWYWHKKKQKLKASQIALKVIKFYPFSIKSWRNFIVIVLKIA